MAEIYGKLDKINDAIASRTFSIDIPENGGRKTIIPKQLFVLGITCFNNDSLSSFNLLYILYFILYTVHFTLYTLHFTLYTLHFTLYTLHFTLYTLYITLYFTSLQFTFFHLPSLNFS
jgi:hypothetical protein